MGRLFRVKLHIRRFSRRHPWLVYSVRSFMIFSAAFGAAYGFVAGSSSPNSGYNPHAFAIGASFLFALACLWIVTLGIRLRLTRRKRPRPPGKRCSHVSQPRLPTPMRRATSRA